MRNYKLLDIDLRLFDGAAAGASAGGNAAGEGAAQAASGALPKAGTNSGNGSGRRSKAGEYDNVVFGKQEDASAAQTTGGPDAGGKGEGNAQQDLEARRKAFQERIKGEDKDLFQEEFQRVFNGRFKETKGMEESLAAQKPIMDLMMQRYQITDGDPQKLLQAIEQDDSYWREQAEEAGYSVEQFKAVKKLERENAEFARKERLRIGQERARQQLALWNQQGEETKALYPNFDLQTELNNPQFRDLLKAKVPVKFAYELIHRQEINDAIARNAAQAMETQVTTRMRAKAARPAENGTSSQSAAIVKDDVEQLSSRDVLEVAKRVGQGKKISFG